MFKDFAPLKGNAFYRIRQIDLDGKFMFSKVVSINSKLSGMVLRYTNPIKDQLLIELTNTNPSVSTEWKLYDLAGRLMMKGIITGNTIKSSLPVSLVHGVYVLEILQGEKRELLKLEK
ncbi:MAG: T9SS type A sorting domain-containing protein [Chitinophagaceae bacterium]|nr:T9SS type A sorting domain-containing protein [Chitinophagaceae bacterium]